MNLVLDTHTLLFALAAPKKLGRAARSAIEVAERGSGRIWVPAIVCAEALMLRELGRTSLGLADLHRALDAAFTFLPLDLAQLNELAALTSIRDPFDRLIVAAARRTNAALVSRDAALGESGLVEVIWS